MALFTLSAERQEVEPGRTVPFRFRILGPDGEVVTAYRTLHHRDLHLIVVRHDLTTFSHLHPERGPDGRWRVDLTLPEPGPYRAFADLAPAAGPEVTLAVDLIAPGMWAPRELPVPSRTARDGEYRVELTGDLTAGAHSELTFTVTRGGELVDLEPYLGARGHLVAVRAEDLAYLHVHPIEVKRRENVRFGITVPSPGAHRLFLEFMHEGRVRTVAFTMDASGPRVPVRQHRDLLPFVTLVFAFSIPLWLVAGERLPLPMNLPASAVLAPFIPLLAAAALTYRTRGRRGVRRLLGRVLDHRRIKGKAWYLPAVLLIPAVFLASYWVMRLLGMPLPEPRLQPLAIPLLFALFLLPAAGEEVGWMGYAADRLEARWSALATGAILGAVVGFWHVVPNLQQGYPPAWVTWKVVESIALRTLFVWLYNNTGRSVFGAILFHDMYNVSWSSFPNDGSHYEPAVTGPIMAVAASIVTLLWGTKTLARFRWARRRNRSSPPAPDPLQG